MVIHSEQEYEAALAEADTYFESNPLKASPEGQRFEEVIQALVKYEDEHYPIRPPTPEEAAAFRREQEEEA